jgi:hypothetical protein
VGRLYTIPIHPLIFQYCLYGKNYLFIHHKHLIIITFIYRFIFRTFMIEQLNIFPDTYRHTSYESINTNITTVISSRSKLYMLEQMHVKSSGYGPFLNVFFFIFLYYHFLLECMTNFDLKIHIIKYIMLF